MSEIALFPLSSVLLPSGRMSLQIFEQRYLDLVAHCMREGESTISIVSGMKLP